MENKVFSISGEKMSSLLIGEDSIFISSKDFKTIDEFNKGWIKNFSFAQKTEFKLEEITSITKEDTDNTVKLKYKRNPLITREFHFNEIDDNEYFFSYLVKNKYFSKRHETLTPIQAILNYIFRLLIVAAFTVFFYYEAIQIENGVEEKMHGGKEKFLMLIVEKMGKNGVLVVGALISCFILYKIVKRYNNPPSQLKLLPPNVYF